MSLASIPCGTRAGSGCTPVRASRSTTPCRWPAGDGRGLPDAPVMLRPPSRPARRTRLEEGCAGGRVAVLRRADGRRPLVALVRTAAAYGAKTANRARVSGFLRDGRARGRRPGAGRRRAGSTRSRANAIVTATAVWRATPSAGRRARPLHGGRQGAAPGRPRADCIVLVEGCRCAPEVRALGHLAVDLLTRVRPCDKARPVAPLRSMRDIPRLSCWGDGGTPYSPVPLTRDDVQGVYAGQAAAGTASPTPPASCRASTPWRTRCRVSSSWRAASIPPTG
ncbi:hypothetical protein SALBM311S_02617 [Streptomyces alboniger]